MRSKICFALLFSLVLSFSCEKQIPEESYSSLSFCLTESPAEYDSVWIEVESMMVLFSNNNVEASWLSVNSIKKGRYNLRDLSNEQDTLFAQINLLSGTISQIRLVLGENNEIAIAGNTYKLEVPSGSSSGIKIKFQDTIEPGSDKKIWLDFDLEKSIIKTGSEKYILKPVIRAYTSQNTGSIKGTVNPKESQPYVSVKMSNETVSAYVDMNGFFLLKGIPAGTYSVNFVPQRPYLSKSIDNIVVTNGECTDLGFVLIE